MKRTFLALCLVLALVVGGVGTAAHTLWDQAGAVAFSAQTRQGDPAGRPGSGSHPAGPLPARVPHPGPGHRQPPVGPDL